MKRTVLAFLKGCWNGVLQISATIIAIAMIAFPAVLAVDTENVWYCAVYILYLIIYFGLEGAFGHETD